MGLLILRFGASLALVHDLFWLGTPPNSAIAVVRSCIAAAAALLLLAGLWTPIASALMVVEQVWIALVQPIDAWARVLLIALGVGLALLGPGAWSIDARLFGRRRVELGDPPGEHTPP